MIDERGLSPTIREIARAFGWRSTQGVVGHLQALKKKGAILDTLTKGFPPRLDPIAPVECSVARLKAILVYKRFKANIRYAASNCEDRFARTGKDLRFSARFLITAA